MNRRSAAFRKACRVLGVDPTMTFEEIACRYHALAKELHHDKYAADSAAAARMVDVNAAWARIKYEAQKRRTRLARMPTEPERTLAACMWPHPPTTRSAAFAGCELRPTENARCYRVLKDGRLLLILDRHPDDERLLFARNEQGRVVRVNNIELWTDVGGDLRPVR